MSPNSDAPDFHSYYNCAYCHSLRSKNEILHFQGKPFCADRTCKEAYHATARTVPRSLGYYHKG